MEKILGNMDFVPSCLKFIHQRIETCMVVFSPFCASFLPPIMSQWCTCSGTPQDIPEIRTPLY